MTDYVLLAGDINSIPAVQVATMGVITTTDQYYACLDGTWNDDGDAIFAEIDEDGDIDVFPDVYIGRIPCRNSAEASRGKEAHFEES